MAKDDYNRIVGLILTYLYARIRGKTEVDPDTYLQAMTKDFPVTEEYFCFILEEMSRKELISGLRLIKAWGGKTISILGMSDIRITSDGIEYLYQNQPIKKALRWIRDNSSPLPGIATTICDILNLPL